MATSKYHNHKVTIGDLTFDSRKEATRWVELTLLQRAGKISDLQRQVRYELIPAQKLDGNASERAVYYVADMVYTQDGKVVVEDVKGLRTDVYKIKRKLMLYRYGIKIKET